MFCENLKKNIRIKFMIYIVHCEYVHFRQQQQHRANKIFKEFLVVVIFLIQKSVTKSVSLVEGSRISIFKEHMNYECSYSEKI